MTATPKLSDAELAEIELRALQATPPPWTAPPYRPTPDSPASYNTVVSEHANVCGLHDGGQTRERIDANAQFIAHAPEDVRALVGALRAERTENEAIAAERDAWKARAREAVRQRDNEARKKQDVWDRLSAELRVEAATSQQLREAPSEWIARTRKKFGIEGHTSGSGMDRAAYWAGYSNCLEDAERALAGSVSLPPTETK